MVTGMIFAALAFGAATLVEVQVVVRMSNSLSSFYINKEALVKTFTYLK